MEKGIYVKDILPDMKVKGVFAIMEPSCSLTKTNETYWKLLLSDSSGTVEARIWAPASSKISSLEAGILALIEGSSSIFREVLQVNINKFYPLSPEEEDNIDLASFIPASPHDREEMFASLINACREEFTYEPWRLLVDAVLNNQEIQKSFKQSRAAKYMHHAYIGGLLEHTLSVFRLCQAICGLYPQLDRQTLLAGALFHDLGKIRELSKGIVNEYTDQGSLNGHITLGLEIIQPFLNASELGEDLKNHLKHLILSHHGEHEFGAPCLPQTPEAFILHYADNMDAKINQLYKLYDEHKMGPAQWSPWQNSLGRRIYNPVRTPDQLEKD